MFNDNLGKDNKENETKYGEFVCSLDHWILPEDQKKQAKRLENITKNKRKKEKKEKWVRYINFLKNK